MSEALATTEEPIDLRASLENAFAADDAAPAPVAETPAAQPRDESGKFAPKTDTPAISADQSIPTALAAPAPEAQPEPIRPPASWSAQAKADFATLAPHIQQEVLRRETEVNKGFEERATKLKQWEPLDAVLAPVRSRLAMNGLNDVSYVQALVAADETLRGPNKVQGLLQLAQQYGIDLRQFTQPGQAPQQQAFQPQPQPVDIQAEIDRRFQEFQNTTQTAQTQAQLDAFAKDNLYYENVRPAMAAIIQTDPSLAQLAATNPVEALKAAYEQACWASPTVRPLMLKEQAAKTDEANRAAATARVNGARQAAGAITGSPAPGSAPTRSGPAPSIRDTLTEAFGGL